MRPSVPYGLDTDLPASSAGNLIRLAEVLGTTTRRIDEQGCDAEIRDLLEGRGVDPLSLREMLNADRVKCCPTAYAICRHAGYDPAALLLLERISCIVEVVHPYWKERLTAHANGIRDGFIHMRLRAPIAPGLIWRSVPMQASQTRIIIDPPLTGLPDTLLIGLHERMMGRPLSELVSHPVTDPLGMVITAVVDPATDDGRLEVHLHPVPAAVTLDEAASAAEEGRENA